MLSGQAIAGEGSSKGGLYLLVVEDNADVRVMLRLFLDSLEHRGCIVSDMASALQAAEEQSFDALLCDILVPDGDGCELLRQLTARGRRPPVAFAMSCYSQRQDITRSMLAGFAEHLIKPFALATLEGLLAEYARKKEEPAIYKATTKGPPMSTSPSPKSLRIIVADDHEWILQIAVNIARETFPAAEIVATKTGLEALQAFEQDGADFLVTNHRMPKMDGTTLVRRVREQKPELPIVMISVQPEVRSEAMAAGAD